MPFGIQHSDGLELGVITLTNVHSNKVKSIKNQFHRVPLFKWRGWRTSLKRTNSTSTPRLPRRHLHSTSKTFILEWRCPRLIPQNLKPTHLFIYMLTNSSSTHRNEVLHHQPELGAQMSLWHKARVLLTAVSYHRVDVKEKKNINDSMHDQRPCDGRSRNSPNKLAILTDRIVRQESFLLLSST